MTAINFEVLIAVVQRSAFKYSFGFLNQELYDSSVYTPVFCASDGDVQHSSLLVCTKYPLFY